MQREAQIKTTSVVYSTKPEEDKNSSSSGVAIGGTNPGAHQHTFCSHL